MGDESIVGRSIQRPSRCGVSETLSHCPWLQGADRAVGQASPREWGSIRLAGLYYKRRLATTPGNPVITPLVSERVPNMPAKLFCRFAFGSLAGSGGRGLSGVGPLFGRQAPCDMSANATDECTSPSREKKVASRQ